MDQEQLALLGYCDEDETPPQVAVVPRETTTEWHAPTYTFYPMFSKDFLPASERGLT